MLPKNVCVFETHFNIKLLRQLGATATTWEAA